MSNLSSKTLLACASLLLLCSCGDGWNRTKVLGQVSADFPNAEIARLPDRNFTFIVRETDGSVWQVEYLGNGLEMTAKARLIGPMACAKGGIER